MLALLPVIPPQTGTGSSTMGLGLLTGGLPFGGAIVLALAIAFGTFWIVEHERIVSRDTQIADLHCQIDGPTETPKCTQNGFRAQLSRANNNLATANANIKDLTDKQMVLNMQIDKLATDSAAAVKRTQALSVALQAANAKAANVARLLA